MVKVKGSIWIPLGGVWTVVEKSDKTRGDGRRGRSEDSAELHLSII